MLLVCIIQISELSSALLVQGSGEIMAYETHA